MNVLSIDLDYITSPYSNFMTKLLEDNIYYDKPNQLWEYREEKYDCIFNNLNVDLKSYFFILDIFNKSVVNSKKVIFSYYHDCILHELYNKDTLGIINIDMHHDLYYSDLSLENFKKINTCSEANWVYFLSLKNKLSKYIWIQQKKSILPPSSFFTEEQNFEFSFITRDDCDFKNYRFDLVFVCLSPQYIVPQHWQYFEILKRNYESITGKEAEFNNRRFIKDFDISKNNSCI